MLKWKISLEPPLPRNNSTSTVWGTYFSSFCVFVHTNIWNYYYYYSQSWVILYIISCICYFIICFIHLSIPTSFFVWIFTEFLNQLSQNSIVYEYYNLFNHYITTSKTITHIHTIIHVFIFVHICRCLK